MARIEYVTNANQFANASHLVLVPLTIGRSSETVPPVGGPVEIDVLAASTRSFSPKREFGRGPRPRRQGLMRISPGFQSPLRVAVPSSILAGRASTMVSNFRNEPQSRPQSSDR